MINPSDQRGGADLWLWLSNLGFVKKSPRVFRPANGSRSIILLRETNWMCIVTSSKRQKITLSSYWSILQLHSSWPLRPSFSNCEQRLFWRKMHVRMNKEIFPSANGGILCEKSGFFPESNQEKTVVKQTSFCCRLDVIQRTMTIVWLNARNIALSTTSQVEIFFVASHDGFLILDWLLLYMISVSNYI